MNRKTLYIILAAVGITLLVALMWWWFLRQPEAKAPITGGTFGSAQGTTNVPSPGEGADQTNIATSLPQQGGETAVNLGTAQQQQTGVSQAPTTAQGNIGVPNVIWLSGSQTNTPYIGIPSPPTFFIPPTPTIPPTPAPTSTRPIIQPTGPGTVFNPKGITPIAGSNPTGGVLPNIGDNGQQITQGDGGLGLAGTAGIAALAGAASCAAAQLFSTTATAAGVAAGTGAVAGTTGGAAGGGGAAAIALSVQTYDLPNNLVLVGGFSGLGGILGGIKGQQTSDFTTNTFLSCIARTIARIALNQITNSVVNWINSGFSGSPSFVQNPNRFFTNVADVAAGSFVKSSALSFLCSPFQLQIRIAIAQSYANRNAEACTLTQVVGNVKGFMNGSFFNGGWRGIISFTGTPTNNPYGAFLFASVGLNGNVARATGQQQNELLQGQGFLSFKQKTNCSTQSTAANDPSKSSTPLQGPNGEAYFTVCDLRTTTPGTVIAQSLGATEKSTLDQLSLAKSFDEIISALITQLMTRTLQGGLSNLSGASGYASNFYTSDQIQAQSQVQALLAQMQTDTAIAQQYGSIRQGSIRDIESTQNQLNTLYNCWTAAATSSALSATKQQQAAARAQVASTTIIAFNASIDTYNAQIARGNTAIVLLEQLQSRALSAGSTSDVSAAASDYNQAKAAGRLITQTDITNAQQDRATLQSSLNTRNQQTSLELQQCYAF